MYVYISKLRRCPFVPAINDFIASNCRALNCAPGIEWMDATTAAYKSAFRAQSRARARLCDTAMFAAAADVNVALVGVVCRQKVQPSPPPYRKGRVVNGQMTKVSIY